MPALEIIIEAIDKTKAAFARIERNVKDLQSSFKNRISKTENIFSDFTNSLSRGSITLGDAIEEVSSKLANLGPAGMAAAAGVGVLGYTIIDSIQTARNFEQAITNAAIVTGAFGKDLEKARESIKNIAMELGKTTVFSAKEAASALYLVASAGIDVSKMSAKDLAPALNLAAATMSDLTSTLDTLLATSTIFNIEFKDSARIADVFTKAISNSQATLDKLSYSLKYAGPIASALNYTLEDTVAILEMLYNAGFKGEQAGTILRGALARLIDPTNEVIDLISELNLNIYQNSQEVIKLYNEYKNAEQRLNQLKRSGSANKEELKTLRERVKELKTAYKTAAKGGLRPFIEILKELEKAGVDSEQMIKIFGVEAGPGMMALLKQGSSALEEYINQLKNAAGTSEKAAKTQLNTFEGSLKLLHSALESLKITLGMALLPILTKFIQAITFLLKPIIAVASAIWQGIKNSFSPLKDIIRTLIDIFNQAGATSIQYSSILELVTKAVEFILLKFRIWLEIISALLKILKPILIPTVQFLIQVINALGIALTTLNNIINQIISTFQNLYNWISKVISGSGFTQLNSIVILVQNAFLTLITIIQNSIFILNSLYSTINTIINILSVFTSSVISTFTIFITYIQNALNNTLNFSNTIAVALSNVKNAFSSVISEVNSLISAIAAIPRNITISVTRTITEITKKITERLPSLQQGGLIKKEGVYYLHKGEEVISAKDRRRLISQQPTKIVNFNFDKIYLSEKYTIKNLEDDLMREFARGI